MKLWPLHGYIPPPYLTNGSIRRQLTLSESQNSMPLKVKKWGQDFGQNNETEIVEFYRQYDFDILSRGFFNKEER